MKQIRYIIFMVLSFLMLVGVCQAQYGRTMNVGTMAWDSTIPGWIKAPGNQYGAYVRSIEFEHSKLHAGLRYAYINTITLVDEQAVSFLINSTDPDYLAHFHHYVRASGPITVTVYRNPTVTSEGSSQTMYPRNETLSVGIPISLFLNSTVSNVGEWIETIGTGVDEQTSAEVGFADEHVLARNTYYFINVVSGGNGNVTIFKFDHYLN